MPGLFDGTRLQRAVTCAICEKAMADCHCPRNAAGEVLLPGDQIATIRLEKRPGNRVVTVVRGLDPVACKLNELLQTLKTRCAAGGSVLDETIILQGDHRPAVREALGAMGYRVKLA